MNDLSKRLRGAERRAKELDAEIQQFVARHPQLSRRQLENDPKFKRLLTLADNADRVVEQLKKKQKKR